MTKEEFGKFTMAMKTFYPRDVAIETKEAAALWYEQLKDIPYQTASLFLNKWVATEKWSPTIADIRGGSSEIDNGDIDDWGNGWKTVEQCIRSYGYYREDEALRHMDDITRQVVERLGFQNICMSENISADRANFRMLYQELAQKKKNNRQLSPSTSQSIAQKAPNKPIETF